MKKTFIAMLVIPLVVACSSAPQVSVIPMADGDYRAVAFAQSERQALEGSLAVAASTCRDREMRQLVTHVDTRFRGAWSSPRDRKDQAAQLAEYVSKPTFPSLEANDDFEVKLQFRCVS